MFGLFNFWKNINTAPKNGRRILVTRYPFVGSTPPYHICWWGNIQANGFRIKVWKISHNKRLRYEPTHWKYLPVCPLPFVELLKKVGSKFPRFKLFEPTEQEKRAIKEYHNLVKQGRVSSLTVLDNGGVMGDAKEVRQSKEHKKMVESYSKKNFR